jgi:hypothetical protein
MSKAPDWVEYERFEDTATGETISTTRVRVYHMLVAQDDIPLKTLVTLMAQCARIDDQILGIEDVLSLSWRQFNLILNSLLKTMS